MTSPTRREQVARIVDPWAFKQCELAIEQGDDDVLRRFLPARELALARADLILALPQPPLSEGWQDIASAPVTTHHMKPILAFWRGRGVQQTYWDVDDDFPERPKGWRSPECGWRCDGDQCIPVNQQDVTHWRPLPDPPLSIGGEGQDLESARDHAPTTCAAPVASDVAGQQHPGAEQ